MTRPRTSTRRWVRAALAALALTLTSVTLAASPAGAETIGGLYISPNPGDQDTYMLLDTDAPCPSGTQAVKAFLTGPGITEDGNNNLAGNTEYGILQDNAAGGKTVPAGATLKQVFQQYGLPQTATYTVTVRCQTTNGVTIFGEFVSAISIVWGGAGFDLTYSQASTATATTTTLAVGPSAPVAVGTQATLTATVAPADASGSVQFQRNGVSFGPAVPVVGGTASFIGAVPQGVPDLTAVFTPEDPNVFVASTSEPVSYLVVPAPILTGDPQVGQSLTCNLNAAAGATTYAWLADGAAQAGLTKASAKIPASWGGKKVACRTVTTLAGRSLTQTSTTLPVKAAPIKNTKLPVVSGKTKVGKPVTCSAGSWSVKPTKLTYQWLRNGKAIKGATKATYKLAKADRKRKVSCRVSAVATGAGKASATSKARVVA